MGLFGKRRLDPDLAAVPADKMRRVASQLYGRHAVSAHAPCQYEVAARKLIARGQYDASDLPSGARGRR
jgi:hypothetical protein